MEAYLLEWANLLLRWLHVIVAIAWIGSSFYFVWLDNSLQPPVDEQLKKQGVGGELWAVHGGGFYNPQKYTGTPPKLVDDLHWFYWESYSTWLSGFSLFSLLYLFNAKTYLIDTRVADLTPTIAVVLALGFLVLGWVVYDLLCRILSKNTRLLSVLVAGYVVAASWGACHLFSGRAAFLIIGAMIATIMSANVFFVIIPGQRKVIAAMRAGEPVNPIYGQRGKQRSVHNTYFTLPVLFAMLSNHYSMTYASEHNWLVLVLIMAAAVLIRQFFILRHKGNTNYVFPVAAIIILAAVAAWIAPKPAALVATPTASIGASSEPASSAKVDTEFAQIQQIVQLRCIQCHAAKPSLMAVAPKGLMLDDPAQIKGKAQLIYQQVVQQKIMPMGNITNITDAERAMIAHWVENGAK